MTTLPDIACELLVSEEGVVLGYYLDQGGRRSWGIGHLVTAKDNLPEHPTRTQVFDQFRIDCAWRVQALDKMLAPFGLNPHQWGALFDFSFNEGLGALQSSDLLKAIAAGARDAVTLKPLFNQYTKIRDKVSHQLVVAPVLVKRRAKELALFVLPMPTEPVDAEALIAGLDVAALLDVSPEHDPPAEMPDPFPPNGEV